MTRPAPHERHVGDTWPILARTLVNVPLAGGDPTPLDLTGFTVQVKMVNVQTGAVHLAQTASGVTHSANADGTVEYDFSSPGADVPGRYRLYFIALDGSGEPSTYPANNSHEVIIWSD
mgnify:FL=1